MSSSETQLIQQVLQKIGNSGDELLVEKSTELLRLLHLKSSSSVTPIGDYAKAVICVHLAGVHLGRDIDFDQCLKISGGRKSTYLNHKRIIEKVLDLNKPIDVNDICIQLKLNNIAGKAKELFELYKQTIEDSSADDVDVIHPQYAAMAVYQACKLNKRRVSRPSLIKYSNLKPQQFILLEKRWDNILQKAGASVTSINSKTDSSKSSGKEAQVENVRVAHKRTEIDVEDYEQWKTRILKKARQELGIL